MYAYIVRNLILHTFVSIAIRTRVASATPPQVTLIFIKPYAVF